jgi:hypothetical protein
MRPLFIAITLVALAASLITCGEESASYCCSYESRHTGCGGTGWTSWETTHYSFNLDDYQEGWSAERVCNKFSGADTNCGGGCCINIEYRSNHLGEGLCP